MTLSSEFFPTIHGLEEHSERPLQLELSAVDSLIAHHLLRFVSDAAVERIPAAALTSPEKSRQVLSERLRQENPNVVAFVYGLERLSQCQATRSLLGEGVLPGDYRFVRFQELAPALFASRAGVIFHSGCRPMCDALSTIEELFCDHFGYLELVGNACQAALRTAALEQAKRSVTEPEFTEGPLLGRHEDPVIATLTEAWNRDHQELAELRNSHLVRAALVFSRCVARALPRGTRRRAYVAVVRQWLASVVRLYRIRA